MVKKIFITLVGLSILIVTYRGGVMVGSRRKMTIGGVVDQIEELTLVNNQPSSWLDLPVDYFSNDDVVWGSAGNWETEEGIRRFTSVALDNRIVYQSYPALNITFERYENEHRLLSIKSYEDVQKRFLETYPEGFVAVTAESNYEDYGDLSTNYLPERHIQQLDEFDVNLDGISERIVTHNFVGRANAGSYGSDIIEGDTIIFSAIADNASIVPAETPNGFYVEWRTDDGSARCCPGGYMRTRFVFEKDEFVPVYEQEIIYLKIGKDNLN